MAVEGKTLSGTGGVRVRGRVAFVWRALVATLVLGSLPASAGVLRYPGPAPCDATLQGCIDGAASGDRIEIAAPTAIDEDLVVTKSITLAPVRGFSPLLGNGPITRVLTIVSGTYTDTGADAPTLAVTVNGLTFNNVQIAVALLAGRDHQLEISDCRLTHAVTSSEAVGIDLDVRVPAQVLLRRNTVITTGKPIRLFSRLPDGEGDF